MERDRMERTRRDIVDQLDRLQAWFTDRTRYGGYTLAQLATLGERSRKMAGLRESLRELDELIEAHDRGE